jgi:hypothetical protein
METAAADERRPGRKFVKRRLAVLTALAATGLYLLYTFDPAGSAYYPGCPLRALTGYQCPGCGTTRALHALLHGEFMAAWNFNPMLFVMSAALAPALPEAARGRAPRYVMRPWFAWAAFVAVVGWWIVRNL